MYLASHRVVSLAVVLLAMLPWASCNDDSGPCDWCGDGSVHDTGSWDADHDGQPGDQGAADSAASDGSVDARLDVAVSSDGSGEAAVGTCTGPVCPTSIEAKGSWFATPLNTEVDGYTSVSFDLTLKNATNVSLTVSSVQVWSLPGVIDLALKSSNLPISDIAAGAEFDLSFTVDRSDLTSCQPGLALRPVSDEKGVLSPTDAPLVSVNEITCQP